MSDVVEVFIWFLMSFLGDCFDERCGGFLGGLFGIEAVMSCDRTLVSWLGRLGSLLGDWGMCRFKEKGRETKDMKSWKLLKFCSVW